MKRSRSYSIGRNNGLYGSWLVRFLPLVYENTNLVMTLPLVCENTRLVETTLGARECMGFVNTLALECENTGSVKAFTFDIFTI